MKEKSYDLPLSWNHYSQDPTDVILTNTGHTLMLTVDIPEDKPIPYLEGGPIFTRKYRFGAVHFHWGEDDEHGSEHTVDDKRYPFEVHAVHYNEIYKNVEEAVGQPRGLCVVGYIGHLEGTNRYIPQNRGLELITAHLPDLNGSGVWRFIERFPLDHLLFPFNKDYVTYHGSLTTKPYSENVTWIIPLQHIPITYEEIGKIKELTDGRNKIVANWRGIQPVLGRPVYYVK